MKITQRAPPPRGSVSSDDDVAVPIQIPAQPCKYSHLNSFILALGFPMEADARQALADVRSSTAKHVSWKTNLEKEGRHNQAERLPSTSSWRARNHRQLPVSCRVSFSCRSFCLGLKKRGSATLASLGFAGLARFGGAGLEMPARRFHQHRSARSALYILPPPREASASEISTASLISQQRLGRFFEKGQGIIDPGNIYLRAINYVR